MPLSRCKSENKFLFLSYVRKVANENFSPLGGANNPPLPGIVDSVHGDQDQVEIAYHRKQTVEGSLIPADMNLPDGGLFKPDLALIDEQGTLLFVEVERDSDKNIEQRQAKWHNFYQTSGGKMFVVCDNSSCMRNIRGEIN